MPEEPPPEPIRHTISGVELVTIPLWHYAELLECQRGEKVSSSGRLAYRAHPALAVLDPRSRLFGDPEVSIFLYETLGRMKLADAFIACRERFGADRSPSKATIGRYWQQIRRRL